MFRRDIKKQFNAHKYSQLTSKGAFSATHISKVPFQKHLVGTCALVVLGFNYTKRFYTMPHHHKDESKPMLMYNNTLHPFENQPKGTSGQTYALHKPICWASIIVFTRYMHSICQHITKSGEWNSALVLILSPTYLSLFKQTRLTNHDQIFPLGCKFHC